MPAMEGLPLQLTAEVPEEWAAVRYLVITPNSLQLTAPDACAGATAGHAAPGLPGSLHPRRAARQAAARLVG